MYDFAIRNLKRFKNDLSKDDFIDLDNLIEDDEEEVKEEKVLEKIVIEKIVLKSEQIKINKRSFTLIFND